MHKFAAIQNYRNKLERVQTVLLYLATEPGVFGESHLDAVKSLSREKSGRRHHSLINASLFLSTYSAHLLPPTLVMQPP